VAALPYPYPLDPAVTRRMRRNPRRDTGPELALRKLLHARGLRFRVDRPLRLDALTVRPDVSFPRWQVAVFVDGCFWHGCPEHGNVPLRNVDYWIPKLQRNAARDRRIDAELSKAGWRVIRAWEHEPPIAIANRVAVELQKAQCGRGTTNGLQVAEPRN
jgi:DNA mismatch endonuclease (patch repair protein)